VAAVDSLSAEAPRIAKAVTGGMMIATAAGSKKGKYVYQ